LVAQRNVLGDEICAVLENGSSNGEKQCKLERHSANDSLGPDTPEKLADSPLYRIVRRHNVEVDIAPLDLDSGDAFVLCSDGLYAMLPDADLKVLAGRSPDPHSVVAWMIDAANQAGGMDNVTAMIAHLHPSTSESRG
jgi:serine/threonine protein phosphatase PrpC